MGVQLYTNSAGAVLNGTIAIGGTTLNLGSGQGSRFPTPTGGDWFLVTIFEKDAGGTEINYEIAKCTARVADALTISRDTEGIVVAAGGTSGGWAYPASVGVNPSQVVYVQMRETAGTFNELLSKSGNLAGLASAATARGNLGAEASANKTTDFSTVDNIKFPTTQAVKTLVDSAVTGLLDDRGGYNASSNTWPSSGGSGTAGAIMKGDIWYITTAGTLGGVAVNIGDTIRAAVDSPGTTLANWYIAEGNLDTTTLGAVINGATAKTTPVDADLLGLIDSAASNVLKKLSWANLKASLKAYFDGIYKATGSSDATGFRNVIVNGRMEVDQEHAGAAQTFTAGGELSYCVDQFYGFCTGANITGQQVAGPVANSFRYRFTGAASNTGVGFGTRLEAVSTAHMASGNAAVQYKISSSSLTSISWTAYYATTKDTFGTLASPTRTQIATGTWTISSTEAIYTASVSVPSGATTGIEIVLTGGALLSGQTLTIGDVQYEAGTTTAVEIVPPGLVLNQCKRFYTSTFSKGTAVAQNAGINTGELYCPVYVAGISQSTVNWQFQTQMRATPTITAYSPGAASSSFWNRSQSIASGAATTFNPSVNGVTVTNQQAAGDVQGNNCGIHLSANARL